MTYDDKLCQAIGRIALAWTEVEVLFAEIVYGHFCHGNEQRAQILPNFLSSRSSIELVAALAANDGDQYLVDIANRAKELATSRNELIHAVVEQESETSFNISSLKNRTNSPWKEHGSVKLQDIEKIAAEIIRLEEELGCLASNLELGHYVSAKTSGKPDSN